MGYIQVRKGLNKFGLWHLFQKYADFLKFVIKIKFFSKSLLVFLVKCASFSFLVLLLLYFWGVCGLSCSTACCGFALTSQDQAMARGGRAEPVDPGSLIVCLLV